MARIRSINPRGSHGLRSVLTNVEAVEATIRKTEKGVAIELSDGRSADLTRDPRTSSSSFIAAAVQWARRHGATSLKIDAELS